MKLCSRNNWYPSKELCMDSQLHISIPNPFSLSRKMLLLSANPILCSLAVELPMSTAFVSRSMLLCKGPCMNGFADYSCTSWNGIQLSKQWQNTIGNTLGTIHCTYKEKDNDDVYDRGFANTSKTIWLDPLCD